MLYLALGYFAAYIPHAVLAKAPSSGVLPGISGPVGGLVLLPAAAIGQLVAMPVFLGASGWWRFMREQRVGGRRVIWPEPPATSLAEYRRTAAIIQRAVREPYVGRFHGALVAA